MRTVPECDDWFRKIGHWMSRFLFVCVCASVWKDSAGRRYGGTAKQKTARSSRESKRWVPSHNGVLVRRSRGARTKKNGGGGGDGKNNETTRPTTHDSDTHKHTRTKKRGCTSFCFSSSCSAPLYCDATPFHDRHAPRLNRANPQRDSTADRPPGDLFNQQYKEQQKTGKKLQPRPANRHKKNERSSNRKGNVSIGCRLGWKSAPGPALIRRTPALLSFCSPCAMTLRWPAAHYPDLLSPLQLPLPFGQIE